MFDKNFVPILADPSQTNFVRMTSTIPETGSDIAHEPLLAQIVVKQAGYMYIWLSNEELTPLEVYFDDFKVTHVKSAVMQSNDYYPFGLSFNSYSRENSFLNKFKFQSQEHVDDLGVNWDSFKWRNHQPDIGRFFNVDPISEKYYYNSPYAFSENKVVAHVELEGLESWDIKYSDGSSNQVHGPFAKQSGAEQYADDQIIISPVQSPLVNSGLGVREAPVEGASTDHKGSDIVRGDDITKTAGTPVVAPLNAMITTIASKDDNNGAGNRISITANSDGKQHNFFHLQDGFGKGLKVGESIPRGTKIGNVGSTGHVSGPHLHYEVRKTAWGTPLNPVKENPGLTNGGSNKTVVPMLLLAPPKYNFQGQVVIQ